MRHINELELLGALFALESFLGDSVEAVHVAGDLNIIADRGSRAECDANDRKLDVSVFSRVNNIWPSHTDLFSSA